MPAVAATTANSIIGTERNPFTADQSRAFVRQACGVGLVPFLVGPPGVGKTDSVEAAASDLGLELVTILLAQRDPVDFVGIPRLVQDQAGNYRTQFAPPIDFPTDRPVMIFYDEFAQAEIATQRAASESILARRVGGIPLHSDTLIVCASNRKADRAGVAEVLSHNKSRMITAHVRADVDSWLEWAINNSIHETVTAYIALKRDDALMPAINHEAYSYPCPRSWSFVSRALIGAMSGKVDPKMLPGLVCAAIGEPVGVEFCKFLGEYEQTPSLEEILKSPNTAKVPARPDAQGTVAYMLLSNGVAVKAAGQIDSVVEYMSRLGQDNIGAAFRRYSRDVNASKDTDKIRFLGEIKALVVKTI